MLLFPDLLDQENAMRKSLAEQVQNRNLSLLDEISKSPNFIRKCWRKNRAGCWRIPQQMLIVIGDTPRLLERL
jgi:hypothetical protein